MSKPVIGITMGDPAGVGPELCLRVMSDPEVLQTCHPLLFGDMSVLALVAKACGLPLSLPTLMPADVADVAVSEPTVVDCNAIDGDIVRPGEVRDDCGAASYAYVEAAAKAALSGRIAAVATSPINKESLRLAGIPYPGHTEMLANLTDCRRFCMMMRSTDITVSLVTTHVGYGEVISALSIERIVEVIELTDEALQQMGVAAPRLMVCGLNPHAGEHGLLGSSEEEEIILPAVVAAREKGATVDGPVPPDTAFLPGKRSEIDAFIVMYHDQGLIPFKMLAFDTGVDVTLGLPIIRTSVDHGTAFDIAWQGKASVTSLKQSIFLAAQLAAGRA